MLDELKSAVLGIATVGEIAKSIKPKRRRRRKAAAVKAAAPKRRRGSWSWPKCPKCGKNASPRGKGYCTEHMKKTAAAKPKRHVTRKAAPKKTKRQVKAAAPKKTKRQAKPKTPTKKTKTNSIAAPALPASAA